MKVFDEVVVEEVMIKVDGLIFDYFVFGVVDED